MSSASLPPNKTENPWKPWFHKTLNTLKAQTRQKNVAGVCSTLEKRKSTSLYKKTRLIFGITVAGFLGVLYAVSSEILLSNLRQAEEHNVRQNIKEIVSIYSHIGEDLYFPASSWAKWDDSYIFVEKPNKSFIQTNLVPEVFSNSKFDLAIFARPNGNITFGKSFDRKSQKLKPIPELIKKHISPNDLLLHHPSVESKTAGILILPEGPTLISSIPILTTQGKGPSRGSLIFGRYVNTAEIVQRLGKSTNLPLNVYSINDPQMPSEIVSVGSALSNQNPIIVHPLNNHAIAGYTWLLDIYGKPALLLKVEVPREIYKQGQSNLNYLMTSLLVVALVFSGITLPLLERLILFQHELKEREERYRAVVAQASEGILLIEANTKYFLEANTALQSLLGYTSEELFQLTLYDVVANNHETIDYQFNQITTPKHYFNNEWQLSCKNGSLVDVEISANSISCNDRKAFCLVVRDITQRKLAEKTLKESERRLAWQASHDPLTELFNRREFEQRVTQAINSAKNLNEQHVLCYLDLDQFKIINDTCGHIVGDAFLRQVSTILQAGLRKTDILARLGGDEFGILLYCCSLEKAVQITNMLRQQIQKFRFIWQEKTFSVGVSIGIVVVNAQTPNLASVQGAADAACYAAKNKGRNRVHVYQADDRELAQQRGEMQWIARIPKALEENCFRLYCQPIVSTTSSQKHTEHFEILLRLEDETGKIVPPMAFIPAAERYNMMHLIDRWVISTLFANLKQHYQQSCHCCQKNYSTLYAVNLSGASINDETFIEFVQEQFAIYQIPPSIICFEVTETLAITNLTKAAQFIRELKALGCKFALDDFGSGMSSFAYLKNLPVDYLKIDGVFVKDIVQDAIASEMVEAISRIASVMGIQTIAEFVENDAIFKQLKALGVDYAQGYGIAPPRPFILVEAITA